MVFNFNNIYHVLPIFIILIYYLNYIKLNENFTDEDDDNNELLNKLYAKVNKLEFMLDEYKKNEYNEINTKIDNLKSEYDDAYSWYKLKEKESEDTVNKYKMYN